MKTSKRNSFLEKLVFWANRRFFMLFHEMSQFLQLFSEKFIKTSKRHTFLEKLSVLGKSTIFDAFSRNERLFATLFRKVRRNLIVSSKSCNFWPNRRFFMLFHEMSHFLQLFFENFVKTSKPDSFLEKMQLLSKSTIFHAFSRNEPLFRTFFRKVDQNLET